MLQELLWMYGAKRQYEMQKENGLAIFISAAIIIFMIWQWDNIFYPLFNSLGLVAIFKNAGLVNENMVIITVINVVAMILLLSFIVAFLTALPMFFIVFLL